jgi:hypothetical protein
MMRVGVRGDVQEGKKREKRCDGGEMRRGWRAGGKKEGGMGEVI